VSEKCVEPGEIREGDLSAYVDGLAGRAVVEHIRRCAACAQQVREIAEAQVVLTAALFRHSCPASDNLIAFHQGELQGGEKLVVAQHLRECPHCARELATIVREERTGPDRWLRSAVEVLEAALMPAPVPAAALRGDDLEAPLFPRVYQAGEVEVILDVQPASTHSHRKDLSGLVHVGGQVPETIGGTPVELFRGEGLIAIGQVSPRGRFTFEALAPASYELALLWGDREIRLRGIEVG
jgi:hypothetical protein